MASKSKKQTRKIRYDVVGAGHIAQNAVMPAFAHAENSELAAIVSDDPTKRRELGEMYGLEQTYDYDDYEDMLARGDIDAVYISLPNNLHCEYTVKAASAGVHVLCEKPMAVTEDECEQMMAAAEDGNIKLMIAYRLHFEKANLTAVELCKSGKLGELRIFNSVFTQSVKAGDVRLKAELGGGTLYDIGVYCINAARYLFRAEPEQVMAVSLSGSDARFKEVDEMTSAVMRFPGDRLASFVCSFGAESESSYRVIGTEGDLLATDAFTYQAPHKHQLTIGEKITKRTFSKRDHFAPELIYFSDCILNDRVPEPSGQEGLADVRIVRAMYESARTGRAIDLPPFEKRIRPTMKLEIHRPAVRKRELVNAEAPSE